MNSTLGKPSRFGNLPLSAHMADPAHPALPDIEARQVYTSSGMSHDLTAVAVNTTVTTLATEPLRITGAQVQTVAGGTVTVQVQADGRDLYLDGLRPVSGSAPSEVSDLYVIPAGTPITTTIEASSGAPAGTVSVAIETEPFRLLPKQARVELRGKRRWHVSERQAAALVNAGYDLSVRGLTGHTSQRPGTAAAQQQQAAQQESRGSGWAFPGGDAIPDMPGGPPKPPHGGGGIGRR